MITSTAYTVNKETTQTLDITKGCTVPNKTVVCHIIVAPKNLFVRFLTHAKQVGIRIVGILKIIN